MSFSGLTKDAVPAQITPSAERLKCCVDEDDMPLPSKPGLGYAGGGFGPYQICSACGEVFGKRSARDGNDQDVAA